MYERHGIEVAGEVETRELANSGGALACATGILLREMETKTLKVRESINNWMAHAPELSSEVKNKVISAGLFLRP